MDDTKKMYLIFHGRFPGEKAASVFAAKSAEAFTQSGRQVIMLAPRRIGRSRQPAKEYYGLEKEIAVTYLPIIDIFSVPFLKRFAFLKSYATFSISSLIYLLFTGKRGDLIYSNEALPLLLISFFFPNTFLEMHDFPKESFFNRMLLMRVKGIIVTNRWKRDEIARRFSIPQEKLFCEPNAVDVAAFERAAPAAMRKKLSIPTGTVLAGYAGALKTMGMEKGIRLLLEALAALPPRFRLLIVGGSDSDILEYEAVSKDMGISERVIFTGWVKHSDVPQYLVAADVLVAPFPNTPHYNFYMSPLKLFEYMATGKPIVASRLHSIEEIVTDSEAFLIPPGDAKALSHAITRAVSEVSAGVKVQRARNLVREHTWQKRALRILNFCSTLRTS